MKKKVGTLEVRRLGACEPTSPSKGAVRRQQSSEDNDLLIDIGV